MRCGRSSSSPRPSAAWSRRSFRPTERRGFRDQVSAGNELALKRIRDHAPNSMAQLGAVRILEQIDQEEHAQSRGGIQQSPGFIINIVTGTGAPPRTIPTPGPATIEHQPASLLTDVSEND